MNPKSTCEALRKLIPAGGCISIKTALLIAPLLLTGLLLPSCNLLGAAVGLGVAKLQFGCLPEGTLIDTAKGPVKIETLKCGDAIVGFDGMPVQITQIHQYRENPATSRYLTIRFSNHSTISASPKHRIDGIPASGLHVGDTCGAHKVTCIESLQGVARSYDLLTEDTGYRIAGIPVNSMIEEMLAH